MKTKPDYDQRYWAGKYAAHSIGWDIGKTSPPIKAYTDQLQHKDLSVLIPGAGNSYEAETLFKHGFSDLNILDIAREPLDNLKTRVPGFPCEKLIQGNFFDHIGTYDLIIEQTFFCALDPELREQYVLKMHDLLKQGGKLIGVLFNFPLTEAGPPFGGNIEAYKQLFSAHFVLHTLEPCYNSIKPRQGNELFIIFEKK